MCRAPSCLEMEFVASSPEPSHFTPALVLRWRVVRNSSMRDDWSMLLECDFGYRGLRLVTLSITI